MTEEPIPCQNKFRATLVTLGKHHLLNNATRYINTDSDDPEQWPVDEESTRKHRQEIEENNLSQFRLILEDFRSEPKRKVFDSPVFSANNAAEQAAVRNQILELASKQVAEQAKRP